MVTLNPLRIAVGTVRRIRYPFLRHEGMTSFAERINLYRGARRAPMGAVVELGPYFGASTVALAAASRSRQGVSDKIHVFDCFKTPETSAFAHRVVASAERSSTAHLLVREGGWLHWDACFDQLTAAHRNILIVNKGLLHEAIWDGGTIGLLHLDMPKDYAVGREAFARFLPSLEEGSLVMFQDFVYQWSAEMIAAFGLLLACRGMRPINLVSTTLTMECTVPGPHLLAHLEENMDCTRATIDRGIRLAIEGVEGLASDEQIAVLNIANCQNAYVRGDREAALANLGELVARDGQFPMVIRGVGELLAENFAQRQSYE